MRRLLVWALLSVAAFAQSSTNIGGTEGAQQVFNGMLYANAFGAWSVPQGDAGQFTWSNPNICTNQQGLTFRLFVVGLPITIVDANPALTENTTITAVHVLPSQCNIVTAPLINPHFSFRIVSGTLGVQEAINYAKQNNLATTVHVTQAWTRLGGQTSMITGAQGNANIGILDERNTVALAFYAWNGATYNQIPIGTAAQPILCTFSTPTTNWSCAHNLGTLQVQVEYLNLTSTKIFPDSPGPCPDVNTCNATFLQPQAGYMLVSFAGNVGQTQLNPNPVVINPVSSQTITGNQPFIVTGPTTISNTLTANDLITGKTPGVDVRFWGARCDNSTNDSSALQTAINFAITNNYPLVMPPGKCRHSSQLTMNIGQNPVQIQGAYGQGGPASFLVYTGSSSTSGWLWQNGANAFIYNPKVEKVGFLCGNVSGCGKGMEAYTLSEGLFRDVLISTSDGNFTTDLYCNGCNINTFAHLTLNGQSATNVGTTGVDCVNCSAMTFSNGDYFYFPLATFRFRGIGTGHNVIHDGWFESQNVAVLFDDSDGTPITSYSLQVHDNRFLFNNGNGVVQGGGAFADQVVAKINNTGSNAVLIRGVHFHDNWASCASSLCSTAYPFVVNISATPGAGSGVSLKINDNILTGYSSGIVNSTSSAGANLVQLDFTGKNHFENQAGATVNLEANGQFQGGGAKWNGNTYVIGRNSIANNDTVDIEDNTPSTGVSSIGVLAGPGQSFSPLFNLRDNSGTLLTDFSGIGTLVFQNANTGGRGVLFTQGGLSRWQQLIAGTESGANAGSNYTLNRSDDSGAFIDSPFQITRSSGLVSLLDGMKVGASGSTIPDTRELIQSAHFCGTTTTCANTANGGNRMVFGSVTLSSGTPSTATVTGISPAFTSSSTYFCTVGNATTQANPVKVANVSGSSFTITGPNTVTDTVNYQCVGN